MLDEFKYWRLCAWAGPLFMAVFIGFWGLMGFNLPPFSAALPAEDIGHYFRENANTVRLGMVIAMTFAVLYMVWGLAIAKVVERVEGESNILSTLALWGAGLTVVPILVSCSGWLAGAYRPEALSDPVLQLLYDWSWLLIDLGYSVTTLQMLALGVAFLSDKREHPLIPRWLAWYGIWVGVSFAAECLMPFFKSGPFERAGLLNFWIEFSVWFVWCPTLTFYILAAIKRLEAEKLERHAAGRPPAGVVLPQAAE
ncbi:hypothetical protein D3874_22425 [Oleomonas cavernae]|uniref:DUF4386 domain-containing protein n=1 Tax=Oleomonas cavernae TaxID=2320859 RepID=A0A418WHC4_9PROT|nr:hypothetical protein [Oleomonas cavernae]RJF89388.1 hypothetical protein D3874_22425 [Oleomonas cavernae]